MLIDREETYKILCEAYPLLQKDYLRRVIGEVPSAEVRTQMSSADLISREDTLEIINKMKEVYFDRKVVLGKVYDQIKDMPSAERVGHWILVTDSRGQHCECSICGEWKYHQNQKYCGDCGARMEGEEE